MTREEAIKAIKAWDFLDNDEKEAIQTLIPELKESEGERMLKFIKNQLFNIKKTITENYELDAKLTKAIEWLDKQEKQASAIRWYDTSLTPKEMRELLVEWDSEDATWHEVVFYHADTKTFWDGERQVKNVTRWCYIDDMLFKQSEQKPNSCDGCINRKGCINCENGELRETEQKPKFHEGDFIKHNRASIICKVISVNSGSYYVENIATGGKIELFNAEQNFHIWTIQDAKDGNVLVDVHGNISIYEKCDDFDWMSYCSLGHNGGFQHFKIEHENEKTYPATKEQSDTLFAKIKEAGWEWDEEKKKLKKINSPVRSNSSNIGKNEPTKRSEEEEEYNGEDYGIDSLFHAQRILEKSLGKVEGYQSDDGILEHKCAINAIKKLYEQKPAKLSEEDEIRLDRICKTLWKNRKGDTDEIFQQEQDVNWLKSLKDRAQPQSQPSWSEEDKEEFEIAIKTLHEAGQHSSAMWLKSLKQRNGWKPSEEQIDAIRYVVQHYNPNACEKLAWDSLKTLEIMCNDLNKLIE